MDATWRPHEKHGELTERSDLPDSVFAFPKERKEPLTDAKHVRNAIARFDQTTGVSDTDRELAFANIKRAAEHYGVDMAEKRWTELGRTLSTGRTTEDRKRSAKKSGGYAQAARARARGTVRLGLPSRGCVSAVLSKEFPQSSRPDPSPRIGRCRNANATFRCHWQIWSFGVAQYTPLSKCRCAW